MKINVDFVILSLYDLYLLFIGIKGYCCTWPLSLTHKYACAPPLLVGLVWTKDIMLLTVKIIFLI
jgi:hypothetical protein